MTDRMQTIRYFLLVLLPLYIQVVIVTASKEDLEEAEANGKLEIIKQIKKVNDDGSYTIGYEADDGTFKIESRDVLGNIKGTYGYVDENGDIKRVSYSTNNGSEIGPAKSEATTPSSPSSVVQRIPKINRTLTASSSSSSTTRRPNISYNHHSATTVTQSTPTPASNVAIQSIPKRRTTTTTAPPTTTTTTDSSKYAEFIKAAVEATKSPANRAHIYDVSSPRILLQQRSIVRGEDANQKSEGQIIRPDVVARPTELPSYRRKTTLLETEGGEEGKTNVLRRQLLPEKANFDAKQHALNLQQSHGDDVVDVYSASLTTGTARPLFTTLRPKFEGLAIPRPTVRYPPRNAPDYEQEASTENVRSTTSNSIMIAQISPNTEPVQEPFIAIRHPVHGRTVLLPLSQLQQANRYEHGTQYDEEPIQQNYHQQQPSVSQIYVAQPRQEAQRFRAIPVRIDENGFVKEMPRYQTITTQYPVPMRMTSTSDYSGNDEEIDLIKPPVSTRDFQKLLEQLILRQSRLEQISSLTKRYQQMFGQRSRPIYRPNLILYRKPNEEIDMRYVGGQNLNLEQQNLYNYHPLLSTPESYTPTRRVARLLSAQHHRKDDEEEEDYLPPDVREMLLLRMLQLAINPSLPLNIPDYFERGFSAVEGRHKKMGGARNVEILGEEDDAQKLARSKR